MVKVIPAVGNGTAVEYPEAYAITTRENGTLLLHKQEPDERHPEPAVAMYAPTEWRRAEVVHS